MQNKIISSILALFMFLIFLNAKNLVKPYSINSILVFRKKGTI